MTLVYVSYWGVWFTCCIICDAYYTSSGIDHTFLGSFHGCSHAYECVGTLDFNLSAISVARSPSLSQVYDNSDKYVRHFCPAVLWMPFSCVSLATTQIELAPVP